MSIEVVAVDAIKIFQRFMLRDFSFKVFLLYFNFKLQKLIKKDKLLEQFILKDSFKIKNFLLRKLNIINKKKPFQRN